MHYVGIDLHKRDVVIAGRGRARAGGKAETIWLS